jgi:hypothetical protein
MWSKITTSSVDVRTRIISISDVTALSIELSQPRVSCCCPRFNLAGRRPLCSACCLNQIQANGANFFFWLIVIYLLRSPYLFFWLKKEENHQLSEATEVNSLLFEGRKEEIIETFCSGENLRRWNFYVGWCWEENMWRSSRASDYA